MFWGCFSFLGMGPLVVVDGSQNQHSYLELLKDYLIPEIEYAERELGLKMLFMQDNATCHKTALIMDFLSSKDIEVLSWPAQSPDLNPIENIWNYIKNKRQKKFGFPATKSDLIDQVMDIWETCEDELLQKLAESIEKRLQLVIDNKGAQSKY